MTYVTTLPSPLGRLTLAGDSQALTGLWMEGQKYFFSDISNDVKEKGLPVFRQTEAYLAAYFAGEIPPSPPPLRPAGTEFQRAVWALLEEIPRGQVRTYGQLAAQLRARGLGGSPRAVGAAVGRNPISILIPCHRCVGADGSLTGYAGGLERKRFLLELEGADLHGRHISARKAKQQRDETPVKHPEAKRTFLPTAADGLQAASHPKAEAAASEERPGAFSCPCCGCRTLPVPPAEAIAYICPVCMWENDVFIRSDREPSDENHGLSLLEGQKNFRRLGVCDPRLKRHARPPRPEELP